MNLHDDKEAFVELVLATSNELHIPANVVEKDYYVTIVLKELSNRIPDMVFKGGTSLTKCYQLLDRFSEDIDISYTAEAGKPGDSRKRRLKSTIVDILKNFDFSINNLEQTRSRRLYNCYCANYPSLYETEFLKSELIIETYIALLPFPTTKRMVDNYIYRFLVQIDRLDIAAEYDLLPFDITVQTIERTFIDKVLAICDYYLQDRVAKHSRHLYDIYKIYPHIKFDENMKKLIYRVRQERSKLSICPSASFNMNINELLKEIIIKDVYKEDYDILTSKLLFVPIMYEDVKKTLQIIAESNIF